MVVVVIQCELLVVPGGQLEQGPFFLTVDGEVITGIHRKQPLDLKSSQQPLSAHLVSPGFIDIHTHGIGEHMYMCMLPPALPPPKSILL